MGGRAEHVDPALLARVLGGSSATSVLGRKLQFEQDISIYASAFYSGVSLDDTTFGVFAVPAEGVSLQDMEDALDKALAEFLEEGVDPEQLARIKSQLRAEQIYADDNVGGLARRYGAALTSGLTVEDIEAWPDVLESVTGEEIVEAARRVFDRQRAVTGWLMKPAQETAVEILQ